MIRKYWAVGIKINAWRRWGRALIVEWEWDSFEWMDLGFTLTDACIISGYGISDM